MFVCAVLLDKKTNFPIFGEHQSQRTTFQRDSSTTFGPAEATCKSAVRTARNIVSDIGQEAASSSAGLQQLASCSLRNAERNTDQLMSKKYELTLPIPLTWIQEPASFPVLRLRDWCSFLLDRGLFFILCGLIRPNPTRECAILEAFWEAYRDVAPSHPVFTLPLDLRYTVPMVFHGDEGRGRRRQGWLVTNFHSLIGRGLTTNLSNKDGKKFIKLRTNYVGSSLTNRFGHASLPKTMYSEPETFDAAMNDAVNEALFMTHTGVTHPQTGQRYHMVTLSLVSVFLPFVKGAEYNRRE